MAQRVAIVDKLLTNVSNMVKAQGLINANVLPVIPVKQRTGLLAGYGNTHLQIVSTRVGGDGEFRRVKSITRESESYHIAKHGIYNLVSEDSYDNVEQPYQAEVDETVGQTSVIQTEKEDTFSSVFNSTNATQGKSLTGTEKFSDSTGTPSGLMTTAQNTILANAGISPNAAIVPRRVYNVLRRHPEIREYYRGGAAKAAGGPLSSAEISDFLDVNRLFIPETPKSSDGKTLSQLWPDILVYLVAPAAAAKYQISFGYRLKSTRGDLKVFKYPTRNPPGGTEIYTQDDYSFIITNAKAAYVMRDVI